MAISPTGRGRSRRSSTIRRRFGSARAVSVAFTSHVYLARNIPVKAYYSAERAGRPTHLWMRLLKAEGDVLVMPNDSDERVIECLAFSALGSLRSTLIRGAVSWVDMIKVGPQPTSRLRMA